MSPDPAPILPLLEALKDDPSDYVRRSVANSINDIAKDHPDLVAALATRWLKNAPPERKRLVRHACRTLIKAGHVKTLEALGFASKPKVTLKRFAVTTPRVKYGTHAGFTVELVSAGSAAQNIVLDYVVHHRKKTVAPRPRSSNGKPWCSPPNKHWSSNAATPCGPSPRASTTRACTALK